MKQTRALFFLFIIIYPATLFAFSEDDLKGGKFKTGSLLLTLGPCTTNDVIPYSPSKYREAYKCQTNINGVNTDYYVMYNNLRCNAEGPGIKLKSECSGTDGFSPSNISIPKSEFEVCKTAIYNPKKDSRSGAGWYIDKFNKDSFGMHHWANSKSLMLEGGQEISIYWRHTITPIKHRNFFKEKFSCDFKSYDSVGGCLFDGLCSIEAITRGYPTN